MLNVYVNPNIDILPALTSDYECKNKGGSETCTFTTTTTTTHRKISMKFKDNSASPPGTDEAAAVFSGSNAVKSIGFQVRL